MTQRKKESALGRGLDALIRMDVTEEIEAPSASEPKKITTKRSKPKTSKNKITKKSIKVNQVENSEIDDTDVREDLVDSVIMEVHKNPRISLWSARSAAVLRLLKKTKPEFSISKEASSLIEDAVKDKYPDLWEVFEDKEL